MITLAEPPNLDSVQARRDIRAVQVRIRSRFSYHLDTDLHDAFIISVSLFGGINVARAFLPYMRERKSGQIIWIGSLAGWQ